MRKNSSLRLDVRPGRLLAVVALVLLSTFTFAASGDAATAYDAEERRFLGLINDYREQNGLRPVVFSDALTVAAERHSKDMAEYGFFAHDTAESSYYPDGSRPWDRMEAEGYDYNTFKGENLAVGYETAEEAMRAWRESPSHNAAMLDANYRVMGVSRLSVPGSEHDWYWTTDFGGHVDPSAHAPDEGPKGGEPQRETPDPAENPRKDVPKPPATPEKARDRTPDDTGALDAGRMGDVGAWSQKARDGADLVVEDGHARLGGYHDGRDELRQKIRVGRETMLAYGLRIKAGSADPDDTMVVRLTDAGGDPIAILDEYTGRGASDWNRARADLSRFAGRTLFLSFEAKTDGADLSTFYLDDLALEP